MSIAGIGSSSGNASQMLLSLLSRLDSTSTSSNSSASTSSSSSQSTNTTAASDGGLTGSNTANLSSMILGMLMQLQQQSNASSTSPASTASSATSSTSSVSSTNANSTPVSKLFSAMDKDGDGTVSQSELESYITKAGGTTNEADKLYSQLTSSSNSSASSTSSTSPGITEAQLDKAMQAGRHGHHHHLQGGQPPAGDSSSSSSSTSASSIGNDLLGLLDSSKDGSVSQSELSNFVTANGGTSGEASNIFSALDTSGSGSLTAANFTAAVNKMEGAVASNPYNAVLSLLNAMTSNSTVSVSA